MTDPELTDDDPGLDGHHRAPPTAEDVSSQLGRILATDRFRRSPRSSAILQHVVHEVLAGHSYRVNARTIAAGAFGADDDEGTLSDAAVRVAVGRLRAGLDRHYEEHTADGVVIEIPTGTYVPRFDWRRRAPAVSPSVAVVVFSDHGTAPSCSHLPFGLAEAVAMRLATITDYRVLGAVDRPADKPREPLTVDVADFVVSGSVRESEQVVRVTAYVAEHGGRILWNRVYELEIGDVAMLAVEDEIVAEIVGSIGDYTGVIHRHSFRAGRVTDDPAIHDALCRYFAYLHDVDPERLWLALDALEHATAKRADPRLRAVAAGMYCTAAVLDPARFDELLDRAAQLARYAVTRVPDDPHALFAAGTVAWLQGHGDLARAQYQRMSKMASANPSLLFGAGVGTVATGDWDEGLALMRQATRMNPGHPGYWNLYHAVDLSIHGDHEAALDAATALDLPSTQIGGVLRAVFLARLDRREAAVAALRDEGIVSLADLDEAEAQLRTVAALPPHISEAIHADAAAALDPQRFA